MADKVEEFEVKFSNLMNRWHNRGLELPANGVETDVDGTKYKVTKVDDKVAEKPAKKAKAVKDLGETADTDK